MDTIDSKKLFTQIEALAALSEHRDYLLRRYLTDEHRRANALVGEWMEQAGMQVHTDAAGNIVGRYEALQSGAPALMLGSHLDSVRDAGRYDGILGVLLPIECVRLLNEANERLPYAVEVIGFGDEEGVRFQSTLLGSRAVAGTFDLDLLNRIDTDGMSMREAMRAFGLCAEDVSCAARDPASLLGYVEVHIEQGPVLEAEELAVGTVSSISGANRFMIEVTGCAGHAGTVPMHLRQDALVSAAAMVSAVRDYCDRHPTLVGTVGQLAVSPGAVNVIPGRVELSVDLRSPIDSEREVAVRDLKAQLHEIARRFATRIEIHDTHEGRSCPCAPWIMAQLDAATAAQGQTCRRLPSGAGHDAMAIADIVPVGMLFVRCKDGISHHPDESMTADDAVFAGRVLLYFLRHLDPPG